MTAKRLILGILIFTIVFQFSLAATKTFVVEETEFVKISPTAVDQDHDEITYTFSEPLDNKGEWQTNYGDAGEYVITIIASDGEDETSEKVKLIVENKNQPPYLTEEKIIVKEKQTIDLKYFIKDPDQNILTYKFNEPFDKNGKWETGYDDAGSFVTEFKVNDGEIEVKLRAEIEVLSTNQPPIIEIIFSEENKVEAKEGINFRYFVEAIDKDADQLNYSWKLDKKLISTGKSGNFIFDYESSGEHLLHLCIKDGIFKITKEWIIDVEDTNRKPVLNVSDLTVNEGEKIKLELPKQDLDGDNLTYTFSEPLNENGEWQTNFEDSSTHNIKIVASDGESETKKTIKINVIDIDRAPQLILPKNLEVKEGEKLSWKIEASDPDGDKLKINFKNAPPGSKLNEKTKTFTWEPDFDTLKRRGGMISNILNSIRLENFLIKKKVEKLEVKVCGKDLCNSGSIPLTIYNTNRGPTLEPIPPITINETEELKLEPKAYDPDGDVVKFFFSKPLTWREGKWQTGYDDEGNYTILITVSDGKLEHTLPINVTINKKNRQPTIAVETDKVIVNEGKEFTFVIDATDPDNDNLTVWLDNVPEEASFKNGVLKWTPSYQSVQNKTDSWKNNVVSNSKYFNKKFNNEKSVTWLSFIASDGEFETVHPVKVTVKNVNRAPEIIDYLPLKESTFRINQPVIFHVVAQDEDQDQLNYRWDLGLTQGAIKNTNTIERTFTTPGDKSIKLTVDDGRNSIEKEWKIKVLDQAFIPKISDVTNFKVYVIDQ